ncbi:cytochrome P450 [Novosphingobium sp. JCM 18896]|uniref:cytochrome P450 n=1 Tax=Novosphingobium sp. JCM 18896 TaxID=2989731 RepID=UPI00222221AE|nr:cytochrome P450 [Novosphingobium sp. JCM 18896]MCW1429615.1 cytochrome P450 [Novosphingobium sp. JCM 18896]
MQALDALDLPWLDYTNPALAADPYPHFADARARHPFLARTDMGVVITEYQAMRDLFGRGELRAPYADVVKVLGQENTPWGDFTERQMIALPAETHRFLRDTFAAKFTPRNANELRPLMRANITKLLDLWAPKEAIDFEEFAANFPISVMFALVGAPQDDIAQLRDDLEVIGLAHSYQDDLFPRIQAGMVRLEAYVEKIIAERRAHPHAQQEDLLDLLINTSDDGNVTHQQLADLIVFFFLAGYDTSKNVLTYLMYTLLDYPEIYERCGEDHDYCRKVIEEGLRYFNPSTVARFVDQEFAYRDVVFPKDQMLFFPLSVSGRDPGSYDEPDRFDPDRPIDPKKRQIAFALGKHMCLGQYIARAQLQEALHQIAQRMKHPQLAGAVGHRPFYGAWGLKGLPITFEEGKAKVFENA